MDANVFKKFYRSFYLKTSGYIPTRPLNISLYPGDFFQIKNGEIIILGNIFRNNVVSTDEVEMAYGISLNPANWSFTEGVTKPYSGRDIGENPLDGEYGYTKQVLAFNSFGSFLFNSVNAESVKIVNWSDISQELIIKLTQVLYSFREVYVVTESVVAENWTLAIGGSDKAELEIASEKESFGLLDLFGASNSKTIHARDIEFYHKEDKKKPSFFKAKKLIVQPEKLDVFISDLIQQQHNRASWVNSFFEYDFNHDTISFQSSVPQNINTSVLDMLQVNQLNPNTCLQYFRWIDANLDDIEKLFLYYGNQS